MILILSTAYDDDTNIVMEHLTNLRQKYIRINDLDLFNGYTKMYYEINTEPSLIVENDIFGKIDLSEVQCVWFRKFGFFENFKKYLEGESNLEMFEYLKTEYTAVLDLFFDFLKNKKWLNNYINVKKLTKANALVCCNKIGLLTPKTFITNHNEKFDITEKYITKSIKDGLLVSANDKMFFFMTKEVTPKIVIDYNSFFPSLFQTQIKKEYELRIFHLNGRNYPMAIFSQNDKQTEIDYRHYNYKKPNRVVPYSLPVEIDKKISQLMKLLG
ncbi:hypothetical protein BN1195_00812 [Chryseobacterium oranimense G311]|nr:hypothetical protein [Chryseobacterium oranimense]CEJ68524.1 hypothetical protein BN1195_00812 [Chryseobacterium oranimense G311]